MINLKKIDDRDFVFINKALSEKEEQEFSDFLRKRKVRKSRSKIKKQKSAVHSQSSTEKNNKQKN